MTTFAQSVRNYETKCIEADIPAETVMAFLVELSQRERYDLYANFDSTMPEELRKEFDEGMARILTGEPMSHVLGYSWFYGYKILVNGDVLIPRYETEELCAGILSRMDEFFAGQDEIVTADIGTGSGAIAITLAKEEPKVKMYATDISEEALVVAKKNAKINDAEITFLCGDMSEPVEKENIRLDVLVCNPPYIPQDEVMEKSVTDFEPHVALFGGEDGLFFYRKIFAHCHEVLKEKAFMAFEMGWNQREAMTSLIKEYLPEMSFEIIKDINGKDRMLYVYRNLKKENSYE